MTRSYTRFCTVLLACLTLGLCLFTAACSDKDRDKESSDTAKVQFVFALETDDQKAASSTEAANATNGDIVPLAVGSYEFRGYDGKDVSNATVLYGPEKIDKEADAGTIDQQTVFFDDVPVDVVYFTIKYFDSTDPTKVLKESEHSVDLSSGQAKIKVTNIHDPETPPTPTTAVTLNITNAYGLDTAQAKYTVIYNSTAGKAQTATGTVDYTVTEGLGSCSIAFTATGENIAVTSVKLSNPTNDIPFEWLDYAEPQAVTDGSLALDVTANKFASSDGEGTEAKPYLVGNPRQLDNVREKCGTETSYKQIRDIDFEGSCGLTISVSVKDYAIKSECTKIDENARFYNSGKGWTAIGYVDKTFVGNYDGDNHTIDGLALFAPYDHGRGLFGYCSACKFSNLTLGEHCTLVGSDYVGALVGNIDDASVQADFSKCHSQATVAGNNCVGGVVGYLKADQCTVSNCSCSGAVYGHYRVAGCVGLCMATQAKIINYQGAGDIYLVFDSSVGKLAVASFAGYLNSTSTFADCICTDTIHAVSNKADPTMYIGGIVGLVDNDNTLSLAFDGTNTIKPTFDFSRCTSTNYYVGGVFGGLSSPGAYVDELKTALAQVTTVNPTGIPEGDNCGKYCGSPKVDSLD